MTVEMGRDCSTVTNYVRYWIGKVPDPRKPIWSSEKTRKHLVGEVPDSWNPIGQVTEQEST